MTRDEKISYVGWDFVLEIKNILDSVSEDGWEDSEGNHVNIDDLDVRGVGELVEDVIFQMIESRRRMRKITKDMEARGVPRIT